MAAIQELAKVWSRSLALYGASAGLTLSFFSDWRAVLQYVPIYNTKYQNEK